MYMTFEVFKQTLNAAVLSFYFVFLNSDLVITGIFLLIIKQIYLFIYIFLRKQYGETAFVSAIRVRLIKYELRTL